MDKSTYWVYMLLCSNLSYYTGYTVDINQRYKEHCNGSSKSKYTRSFSPINLAQCWQIEGNKRLAMQIEHYIKKLTRQQKEQLVLNPQLLAKHFPVKHMNIEQS